MITPSPAFGRFELLRRVSIGGSAEIFKAKAHGPLGFEKVVALKRLLPHAEENPDFVGMFVDESKLIAQLDDPRIARLIEVGQVQGAHYIAMEYIYGRDLRAVQRVLAEVSARAEPRLVAAIGAQAAAALDYAHHICAADGTPMNVVHRDVSPQNLMITDDGVVKLIDFGIAKFSGRGGQTQAGIVKGKHAYMSPEQVRGEPLDGRSDVFSLGIVLFELATGQRLFKAPGALETMARVEAADVPAVAPLLSDAPPALARWIQRCLARDPADRPPRAGVVANALSGVLAECDLAAPEPVVSASYRLLFGDDGTVEEEVTLADYRAALRAIELGEDQALARRDASDITIVPDTSDLAAYLAELSRRVAPDAAEDGGS